MGNRTATAAFISLLLITGILLSTLTTASSVYAQAGQCGPTYVILRGDTFFSIARQCGVSTSALQAANPQVTDPNRILPGQVLNIPLPVPPTGSPQLQITPLTGGPGTTISVSGSGFTPGATVRVGIGMPGGQLVNIVDAAVAANGTYTTLLTIPTTAQAGQSWVVQATDTATGGSAVSPAFIVAGQAGQGAQYTVQRGDTLYRIARTYNTSVQALLAANPQITDPNRIAPGQVILIPGAAAPIPPTGPVTPGTHTVQAGETLFRIAQRYGTTVAVLLQLNPDIRNAHTIYPGQIIRLPSSPAPIPPTGPQPVPPAPLPIPPTGGTTYVIQRGDTLASIAIAHGTTTQTLLQLNPQITNPGVLEAGRALRVR